MMDTSVEDGNRSVAETVEVLEPTVANAALDTELKLEPLVVSAPVEQPVDISGNEDSDNKEIAVSSGEDHVTEDNSPPSSSEIDVKLSNAPKTPKPITQASINDVATNLFSKYLISAEINARASIQLSRVASPEGNSSDFLASTEEPPSEPPSEPPLDPQEINEVPVCDPPSNIAEERDSIKESEYTEGSDGEGSDNEAPVAATAPSPPRRKYSFEDDDLLAEADSLEEAAKSDKASATLLETIIDDLMYAAMADESLLDLDVWNLPPIADTIPTTTEEVKPKKAIKKKIKKKPATATTAAAGEDTHNNHASRQSVKTADLKKPHKAGEDESQLYPHYSELVTGIYKRPIIISILVSKKQQKKGKKRSTTAPNAAAAEDRGKSSEGHGGSGVGGGGADGQWLDGNNRPSSPESDVYLPSGTAAASATLDDSGVSETDDPLHRDISSVVSVNENKPGTRGPRFKSFVIKAYDLVESKEAATTVNLYDYNILLEDIAVEHQTEAVLEYYQPASLPWWSKHLKKLVRVFVRHTGQLCVIVDRGLIKKRVRDKMRYHSWLMESLQLQASSSGNLHGAEPQEGRELPTVSTLQNWSEFTEQLEPGSGVNGGESPVAAAAGEALTGEEPSTVFDAVREEPSISNYQTSVDSTFNFNATGSVAEAPSESETDTAALDFSGNWEYKAPLPVEGAIIYENPSDAGMVLTEDDEGSSSHKRGKKKKQHHAKKEVDKAHRRFKVVEPHPVVVQHHGQYHMKPLNEPAGGWNMDVHVPKTFSVIPRTKVEPRALSPARSVTPGGGDKHSSYSPAASASVSFAGSLVSASPWNDNPNINPMKIIPRDPSPPRTMASLEGSGTVGTKKKPKKRQQQPHLESLNPSQSMPVLVSTVPVTVPGLPHQQQQQQHVLSKSHNDLNLAEVPAPPLQQGQHRTAPNTSHGPRAAAEGGGTPARKKKRRVRPKTVPEPTEFLKPVTPPPAAATAATTAGTVSTVTAPTAAAVAPPVVERKQPPKKKASQAATERSILDEMSLGSADSFEGGDGKTTEEDVFNAVHNIMFSLPQLKSTTASASVSGKSGSVMQRSVSRQSTAAGGIEGRRSSNYNVDARRNSTRLPSISGSFAVPAHISSTALALIDNQESPETAEVASKGQQKALEIIKGVRATFTSNPSYKYQRMSFQEVKLLDSPFAKKVYYTPEETAAMNAAAERAIKTAIANNTAPATTGGR